MRDHMAAWPGRRARTPGHGANIARPFKGPNDAPDG